MHSLAELRLHLPPSCTHMGGRVARRAPEGAKCKWAAHPAWLYVPAEQHAAGRHANMLCAQPGSSPPPTWQHSTRSGAAPARRACALSHGQLSIRARTPLAVKPADVASSSASASPDACTAQLVRSKARTAWMTTPGMPRILQQQEIHGSSGSGHDQRASAQLFSRPSTLQAWCAGQAAKQRRAGPQSGGQKPRWGRKRPFTRQHNPPLHPRRHPLALQP